jgi:DNA-binding NtrC family response regulator
MDCWETLDHLAHLKPSLPVIVITAQPHQKEWAQAEGARLLMEKPLDLRQLLDRICECIVRPSSPPRESSLGFRFSAEEKSDFRFADRYRGWGID